jgi:hypothetical protein
MSTINIPIIPVCPIAEKAHAVSIKLNTTKSTTTKIFIFSFVSFVSSVVQMVFDEITLPALLQAARTG